jgi:hypothetical protein
MFLESYYEKKDQFRKWMVSNDWKESAWKNDADYVFAEELQVIVVTTDTTWVCSPWWHAKPKSALKMFMLSCAFEIACQAYKS